MRRLARARGRMACVVVLPMCVDVPPRGGFVHMSGLGRGATKSAANAAGITDI